MHLLSLLAAFCFMFVHCASDQAHVLHQNEAKYSTTASSLPRKLKLSEEAETETAVPVKRLAVENAVPYNNLKNIDHEASSGYNNLRPQENAMHAKGKDEWREMSKESEYFTMDYPWVRRRRPIHNKQVPFVP